MGEVRNIGQRGVEVVGHGDEDAFARRVAFARGRRPIITAAVDDGKITHDAGRVRRVRIGHPTVVGGVRPQFKMPAGPGAGFAEKARGVTVVPVDEGRDVNAVTGENTR
ncbi:hypothetical protein SDC9_146435 [bioreactor metagenome]|uniref:Uncharacterized protein n=1 Tax=bioreactor metagenome TaxID=1076179 RepID=A0A645EAZ3_9ZZZZ